MPGFQVLRLHLTIGIMDGKSYFYTQIRLPMNLSPEMLEKNGYVLIETLDHSELVPFVRKYLYRSGLWPFGYFGFNLLMFLIIGVLAGAAVSGGNNIRISDILGMTFAGFALSFLLIPLHEFIHAIAYRMCGAREVSYDADLKKMVFMAMAHRFVTSAKELRFVALAPFATISLLALATIPFLNGYHFFTVLGLIFTHAAFCGGDFAMISYLNVHNDKEVVTWDDKFSKVSWFYGKPKSN